MLSFIAPHYCCGCDKIGSLLCANCKNNIIDEASPFCIMCCRPTAGVWLCNSCRAPFEKAWVVGRRDGILQRIVGLYKFQRTLAGYRVLGDLLLAVLPELPPETIIVPVPTVSSHVRERGYDHMLLIAKYVARKRGLKLGQILYRQTGTKQRQADAGKRRSQAERAFAAKGVIDRNVPYLLIDDVVTTGATIKYASKALRDAGAEHIWVAAIARQFLK